MYRPRLRLGLLLLGPLLCLVLLLSGLPTLAGNPSVPGDPDSGRQIAERWCAACHIVAPQQERAADAAVPSFMAIATGADGLEWLEGFLADPHPPMPDLSLTRQEIRDLRAYFAELAK